jgi:hypothetical protein
MKYLFVFGVVMFFVMLIAVRYRKQINAAAQVARMLRDARQGPKEIQSASTKRDPMAAESLVKCAGCGTWVPENRAKRIRTGDLFCSEKCIRSRSVAGR